MKGKNEVYVRSSIDLSDHADEELIRLRNRTKKGKAPKPKRVNPNILPYPKHIIYAAIGHHDPPHSETKDMKDTNDDRGTADVLVLADVP